MLGIINLLAEFFDGLPVNDDGLIIGVLDISLVILMPLDRHHVIVEIRNSFLWHNA